MYIRVDASDYAAGGILSQKNVAGELHPVAYYSISLSKSRKNWSPHTKEAYVILMAVRQWHVQQWRVYLAGAEFTIKSDHNLLLHIRNTKNPKGKFARWLTELEEYRYTIEYIPGRYNQKADTLFRNQNASEWTDNNNSFEDNIYVMEIENLVEKNNIEQEND